MSGLGISDSGHTYSNMGASVFHIASNKAVVDGTLNVSGFYASYVEVSEMPKAWAADIHLGTSPAMGFLLLYVDDDNWLGALVANEAIYAIVWLDGEQIDHVDPGELVEDMLPGQDVFFYARMDAGTDPPTFYFGVTGDSIHERTFVPTTEEWEAYNGATRTGLLTHENENGTSTMDNLVIGQVLVDPLVGSSSWYDGSQED